MTFNQLKVFQAVSTHLSITRASEALGISEPSVFQQVKSLEEWIGAKLYRKTGRRIELTQAGRDIQNEIRDILSELSALEHRFRQNASGSAPRRLIVGASHAPSTTFLPSIIAIFKKHHPQVQVTLRTKTSRSIEKLLAESEVDIALITSPSNSPLFEVTWYRTEDFVAFVSAKHPFANKHQLTLAEVAQCPLIIKKHDASKGAAYARQLEARGFEPNILMECESTETIKTAVRNGMGLGFLYHDHVQSEVKRGELKILRIPALPKPAAASYVVYRKDRMLSVYARDFLDLMQRAPQSAKPGSHSVPTTAQTRWTSRVRGEKVSPIRA